MTQVAIICSVIPERHDLLLRSIKTWQHSIEASGLDAAICIWSEGCPVGELISKIVEIPHNGNISIAGQEACSGSPELGSNYFFNEIKPDVYMFLHPEIMLPTNAVKVGIEAAKPGVYCTFRIYWIPVWMTDHLTGYPWMPPEGLEDQDDLYQYGPSDEVKRYLNQNVRENDWHSDTCYTLCSEDAHKLFPVPVFGVWGPIDAFLAGARARLGIRTYNPPDPVYHQAHPRIEGGPPGYAINEATRELIKKFGV